MQRFYTRFSAETRLTVYIEITTVYQFAERRPCQCCSANERFDHPRNLRWMPAVSATVDEHSARTSIRNICTHLRTCRWVKLMLHKTQLVQIYRVPFKLRFDNRVLSDKVCDWLSWDSEYNLIRVNRFSLLNGGQRKYVISLHLGSSEFQKGQYPDTCHSPAFPFPSYWQHALSSFLTFDHQSALCKSRTGGQCVVPTYPTHWDLLGAVPPLLVFSVAVPFPMGIPMKVLCLFWYLRRKSDPVVATQVRICCWYTA